MSVCLCCCLRNRKAFWWGMLCCRSGQEPMHVVGVPHRLALLGYSSYEVYWFTVTWQLALAAGSALSPSPALPAMPLSRGELCCRVLWGGAAPGLRREDSFLQKHQWCRNKGKSTLQIWNASVGSEPYLSQVWSIGVLKYSYVSVLGM